MPPVPTRQIHLDFHRSEHIPGVGSRFSKAQFQEALQLGHVNLINIFGKGHHGWCYYPTVAGAVHPALQPFTKPHTATVIDRTGFNLKRASKRS